jgi:hypothetical protein
VAYESALGQERIGDAFVTAKRRLMYATWALVIATAVLVTVSIATP